MKVENILRKVSSFLFKLSSRRAVAPEVSSPGPVPWRNLAVMPRILLLSWLMPMDGQQVILLILVLCVSAALSDTMSVDAVFLPDVQPSSVQHANTWLSILSHGAFSSHTLPPSPGLPRTHTHTNAHSQSKLVSLALPADLIEMASQLANQRLICVLEACQLGGATTEILITRGFLLEG